MQKCQLKCYGFFYSSSILIKDNYEECGKGQQLILKIKPIILIFSFSILLLGFTRYAEATHSDIAYVSTPKFFGSATADIVCGDELCEDVNFKGCLGHEVCEEEK